MQHASARAWHSCFVTEGGALYTCGGGLKGESGTLHLGHGRNDEEVHTPRRVEALRDHVVVEVAAGDCHTLARLADGSVVACGRRSECQLGAALEWGPAKRDGSWCLVR